MFEVAIVGAGAAGLNAALVLGRARRRVLLCDDGKPRNSVSGAMHGFLSRDGAAPAELLATGRSELKRYPNVTIVDGRVTTIAKDAREFALTLQSGERHQAKRVLFATGMSDVLPKVEGMTELWGCGVHVCPYCDGWEVADRTLAVYGSLRCAVELAQELYQWSHSIVVFAPAKESLKSERRRWLARANVRVVIGTLGRLARDGDRLTGIEMLDGTLFPCDALFLSTAMLEHSRLPESIGCKLSDDAMIKIDEENRTTLRGCYAAGDAVIHHHQVIIAAASGVKAAIAINDDLTCVDVADLIRSKRRVPDVGRLPG